MNSHRVTQALHDAKTELLHLEKQAFFTELEMHTRGEYAQLLLNGGVFDGRTMEAQAFDVLATGNGSSHQRFSVAGHSLGRTQSVHTKISVEARTSTVSKRAITLSDSVSRYSVGLRTEHSEDSGWAA